MSGACSEERRGGAKYCCEMVRISRRFARVRGQDRSGGAIPGGDRQHQQTSRRLTRSYRNSCGRDSRRDHARILDLRSIPSVLVRQIQCIRRRNPAYSSARKRRIQKYQRNPAESSIRNLIPRSPAIINRGFYSAIVSRDSASRVPSESPFSRSCNRSAIRLRFSRISSRSKS